MLIDALNLPLPPTGALACPVLSLELTAVETAHVAEREAPILRPDWVLVRVLSCGLCGTDRHIFRGEYPATLPLVPGHEFGGTIEAVGPDSAWRAGDLVSVDPNICCGTCAHCRAGRVALCPDRYALGVDIDGGLSELVAVPERQLHRMSADVDPLHLSFVEPLACCLRGMDLANLEGAEHVAVIGGGVIGQLVVQLAARAGAERVTLITRQEARRRLAVQLGATDSADPAAAGAQLAARFDVVFECAGALSAFEQAQVIARRGGSVILLGIPPQEAVVPISPYSLVYNELRIQGSFLNPLTHERAAQLVSAGILKLDPLVSRVLALDDVAATLTREPGYGDIKYIVVP